jgi:hypothetical protein
MTTRLPVFCLLSVLLCLAGCAHYQLGTDAKLKFATLYIEPVANKTLLPQARAIVSTQLREAFIHDARVTLVNSAADADATLSVTISDYHREMTVAREDDTGLARKFALTLGTTCTLRDNRSGQVLFNHRAVSVQRDAFTDSGQLQAEYQMLPILAEALAQKLTHTVLDVW